MIDYGIAGYKTRYIYFIYREGEDMAKYLFVAQSDCIEANKEEEFNRWLEEIHIPDIFKTSGIVKATRYVNTDPATNKRPKNMVVYEIETDDIKKFDVELNKVIKEVEAAGRILNSMVPERAYPFAMTYYLQVSSLTKKK
jgi:hypothetical protein